MLCLIFHTVFWTGSNRIPVGGVQSMKVSHTIACDIYEEYKLFHNNSN